MKSGTFTFYNKSVGTFYRVIYSVLIRVCISHYVLLLDYDSRMSIVRYRTSSGSGKYVGFELRTGAEKTTTIVVDIFDTVVRNTAIHRRVDEEQWRIVRGSKRQAGGSGPLSHY